MTGFIIGLLLSVVVVLSYVLYTKMYVKTEAQRLSKEELEQIKEREDHFSALFDYNVDRAYSGGGK